MALSRSAGIRTGVLLAACACSVALARGNETPASSGEAARVETPLLRIPSIGTPPVIDGVMTPGEWDDASAASGFWYWNYGTTCNYDYMAPFETQLQVYGAFDKENLYLAFTSPVYPVNSWLRARGRFPDVIEHPMYGIYRDDYVGLGLWPYGDPVKSYRMGQYTWFINCINIMGDSGPGLGKKWQSRTSTRGIVTRTRWVQELAIPLENLVQGPYAGTDGSGQAIVKLPPPDGTTYLFRLDRCDGEWGIRGFHNKLHDGMSRLVFDSQCVSFQVNELGPIMEDIVDVRLTAKNHSTRSQTLRLGFFVENAAGSIYSSYADRQMKHGLLELRPGEARKLRLRKPIPGISENGNLLWFDVRTAGRPATPVFRTCLVEFHSQDKPGFREFHIAGIDMNRPPRKDFDLRVDYAYHNNTVSAVADTGIHGASEAARTAVQARFTVSDADGGEIVVRTEAFRGPFACCVMELPELTEGRTYTLTALLFDRSVRIVGEDAFSFVKKTEPWMHNRIGIEDVVWEPFVPIRADDDGFETLNHRFTLDSSGLPRQVFIKPAPRDLPLERRGLDARLTDAELVPLGRGPQLRAPVRLVATVEGKETPLEVVRPAEVVRQWKSEIEYTSGLALGVVAVDLIVQYDCDGAMSVKLSYGADAPAMIDQLELVFDIAGPMDMTAGQGKRGLVWSSAEEDAELYYSHFVPWLRIGSNERAFSWICRNEQGWILDRDGPAMTLHRDADDQVTWRVKLVNHAADVRGRRTVEFMVLTHPSKPKPAGYRKLAWLYRGDEWARKYVIDRILTKEALERMSREIREHDPRFVPYEDWTDYLRRSWRLSSGAPADLPYEEARTWRKDQPPWVRYGIFRNGGISKLEDKTFEEKSLFYNERQVRVGRRCGFWWDEHWPMHAQATWSDDLATGDAYLRDPDTVKEGELPWHRGFLTTYMRSACKRLARVFVNENVPQRNGMWANDAASAFESFLWDTMLVEWTGSDHNSYELDSVVCYTPEQFRFYCQKWTGAITRVVPGYGGKKIIPLPGDDKRFDRQYLGRALLHDIGASFDGPHGSMHQPEEGVRLLNIMDAFGLFDEEQTEFLPYWRNRTWVRYGQDHPERDYTEFDVPPETRVHVTVYRRPTEQGGGTGYKALFVIMNESEVPVHGNLRLLDPGRILGGTNTLALGAVVSDWAPEHPADKVLLQAWAAAADGSEAVLRDMETGRTVSRVSAHDGEEAYGPVYVAPHHYRLLYGHHLRSLEASPRTAGLEAVQ